MLNSMKRDPKMGIWLATRACNFQGKRSWFLLITTPVFLEELIVIYYYLEPDYMGSNPIIAP